MNIASAESFSVFFGCWSFETNLLPKWHVFGHFCERLGSSFPYVGKKKVIGEAKFHKFLCSRFPTLAFLHHSVILICRPCHGVSRIAFLQYFLKDDRSKDWRFVHHIVVLSFSLPISFMVCVFVWPSCFEFLPSAPVLSCSLTTRTRRMGNTLKIKGKHNVCMSVEGLVIRLRSSTQSQVERFWKETNIISYISYVWSCVIWSNYCHYQFSRLDYWHSAFWAFFQGQMHIHSPPGLLRASCVVEGQHGQLTKLPYMQRWNWAVNGQGKYGIVIGKNRYVDDVVVVVVVWLTKAEHLSFKVPQETSPWTA